MRKPGTPKLERSVEYAVRAQVRETATAILALPETKGRFATAVRLIGMQTTAGEAQKILAAAPLDPPESAQASTNPVEAFVNQQLAAHGLTAEQYQANPQAIAKQEAPE